MNPEPVPDASEPSAPKYFKEATIRRAEKKAITATGIARAGQKIKLALERSLLKATTNVTVTLYSKPTVLGTYETAADGSLSQDVVLPSSTEPGRHVLLVEATAANGEEISFYQFLEITSSNSEDVDGDGVRNAVDRCRYIEHWYDESSKKDVCQGTMTQRLVYKTQR